MRILKLCAVTLLLAVTISVSYAGYLVSTNNFHEVIPGRLYRSAQPSADDIAEWHDRYGIATIVNLRGAKPGADWYRNEQAAARRDGITLVDFQLSADRDLSSEQIDDLLALLRSAEGPILVHCYRGADRSGIASALYLAGVAGSSEFDAEMQLTPIYGHVPLWFLPAFAMVRSFEMAETRLGFLGS